MEVGTNVSGRTVKDKRVTGTLTALAKGWGTITTAKGDSVKVRSGTLKEIGAPSTGTVIEADLSKYTRHETKTSTGRKHVDVDDQVAQKLRELDLEGSYSYVAKLLEESVKDLKAKYGHLNAGMQRMNLGNRARAVFRLGEATKTGFSKHKATQS